MGLGLDLMSGVHAVALSLCAALNMLLRVFMVFEFDGVHYIEFSFVYSLHGWSCSMYYSKHNSTLELPSQERKILFYKWAYLDLPP